MSLSQVSTTWTALTDVILTSIGVGPKSEQLTAKTKGVEPTVPEAHRFLEVSAGSVTLHLNAWMDGGCPILYFVVEYKPRYLYKSDGNR